MRQYLEQRTFRNNLKQYEKGKWPLISQTIEQQSANTRVTGFRNRVLETLPNSRVTIDDVTQSNRENQGQAITELQQRIDIMRCVYQLNRICVTNNYEKQKIDAAIKSVKEDIENVFECTNVNSEIKVTLLREYIGLKQQYKFDNGITFDDIFDQEGILGSLQKSEATYELASYLSNEQGIMGSIDDKLKEGIVDKGGKNYKLPHVLKMFLKAIKKLLHKTIFRREFTKTIQEKIAKAAPSVQDNRFNKENKGPQNTR